MSLCSLSVSNTTHPRPWPSYRVSLDWKITVPVSVRPNTVPSPACSGSRAPRTCLQKGRDVPSQPPSGTSVGITSLTQRLPTKSHQTAPHALSRRVQMRPETKRQRLGETEGDKAHFAAVESLLSKKRHPTSNHASRNVTATEDRVLQLPEPERSHLPVSPLQGSPLSPLGPPAPRSLTQLFPPPSVANTCSGSGRTAGVRAPESWVSGSRSKAAWRRSERLLPLPPPPPPPWC